MKSLTITISDETAAAVEEAAAQSGRAPADVAAEAVATFYPAGDWYDDLDDDAKAAIAEGEAQIKRGETIPHEQVVAELRRKHGW